MPNLGLLCLNFDYRTWGWIDRSYVLCCYYEIEIAKAMYLRRCGLISDRRICCRWTPSFAKTDLLCLVVNRARVNDQVSPYTIDYDLRRGGGYKAAHVKVDAPSVDCLEYAVEVKVVNKAKMSQYEVIYAIDWDNLFDWKRIYNYGT